jgi:hypothetical protein
MDLFRLPFYHLYLSAHTSFLLPTDGWGRNNSHDWWCIKNDENFCPHFYASHYSMHPLTFYSCDKKISCYRQPLEEAQRLNMLASGDGKLWSGGKVVMIEEQTHNFSLQPPLDC